MNLVKIKKTANLMRAYALIAIHNAGSGHSGGSLSAMDIMAVLFLEKLRLDPKNPYWKRRDRFFLSKAHASAALYVSLAMKGFCSIEDVMTYRKLTSTFQGHPDMKLLKSVEISGGSLGQGLGVAVGDAISGKIKNENYRVYCLMGDGEQQEGSIWEAVMSASKYKLDNLTAIIDRNRLQIDGCTEDVMGLDDLAEKYRAFGWHAIKINGHNIEQISEAIEKANKVKDKPCVIVAETIKGKGVSFMENNPLWHSKAPGKEQLLKALKELGCENIKIEKYIDIGKKYDNKVNKIINGTIFHKEFDWNKNNDMKAEMESTRDGFSKALSKIKNDKLILVSSDSCKSVFRTDYKKFNKMNERQILNLGIAEQNMTNVAAGLAKEGLIPFIGAYGVFSSGRNWDQLRNIVCYSDLNVKIAGVGGLTIGPDGASHQALEEFDLLNSLPNMKIFSPCDSIETEKIVEKMITIKGPCYLRLGKSDIPIVTDNKTPFKYAEANIIRYRKAAPDFKNAFEHILASKYRSENEDIVIFATGVMVPEAMRASYILKEKYDVQTRVVNIHTIKPIDKKAVVNSVRDVNSIIVAEEHRAGGLGNIIAGIMLESGFGDKKNFKMIGVNDRFGESGESDDLIRFYGLSADNIVRTALKILF